MDLTDQRLACLRMAMELNCKTEPLLKAANELMGFIATGSVAATAPDAAMPEAAIDTIAACGTALQMPEGGGLEAAQPVPAPEQHAGAPNPEPDAGIDTADLVDVVATAAEGPADGADAAANANPQAVADVVAASADALTEADLSADANLASAPEPTSDVSNAEASPDQPAAVH